MDCHRLQRRSLCRHRVKSGHLPLGTARSKQGGSTPPWTPFKQTPLWHRRREMANRRQRWLLEYQDYLLSHWEPSLSARYRFRRCKSPHSVSTELSLRYLIDPYSRRSTGTKTLSLIAVRGLSPHVGWARDAASHANGGKAYQQRQR